jgi:release factor glutamine methyltransferase
MKLKGSQASENRRPLRAEDNTLKTALTSVSLRIASHSELPNLDAQVLLAHILGQSRAWVLAHPEYSLNQKQQATLEKAALRLEQGEPLPYIIGHWEFYGLDFQLTSDVLIPRPETELLVDRGLHWLRRHPKCRTAIDVGTGSGCIGIALAANVPDLRVVMTDISREVLNTARMNANKHGVSNRMEFCQSNMLDGIQSQFDLVCANLPYIPTQVLMSLPVYQFEPRVALDGGANGIELIRHLLAQGKTRLAHTGVILMEIETSQGEKVKSIAQANFPKAKIQVTPDLAGWDRCVEIEQISLIAHICPRRDWSAAVEQGEYRAQSLEQIGFIHCSQVEQILAVANRYYHGMSDLVILWINTDKVQTEIRWQQGDGEIYPHIYGPINMDSVIDVTSLIPDKDGNFLNFVSPVK